MNTIEIKIDRLKQLLEHKKIFLENNANITILNNLLILIHDNEIYDVENIKIKFAKRIIENKQIVEYIHSQICEYINVESSNIIFISQNKQEFIFLINFYNKNIKIIVIDALTVIENAKMISDNPVSISSQPIYIGPYRKLGNSAYYFRWLDEI